MASDTPGSSRESTAPSVSGSKISQNSKETSKETIEKGDDKKESAKTGSVKSDTAKSDSDKSESVKSGSDKADSVKSDSDKTGAVKSGGDKVDVAKSSSDAGESDKQSDTSGEPEGNKSVLAKLRDAIIVPVTKENILYHYLPLHGVVCYSAMSVNVMNPSIFSECCPKKDVTNFLLFGSVSGIGLYIYSRPHLQSLEEVSRIGYSAFGAVMFTFGSVLIWAVMRSVMPGNVVVSSALGLLSAAGLAKCGSSYCNAVDSQIQSSTSTP